MWERLKVGKLHVVDYELWWAGDLPEHIEPVYSQAALDVDALVVLLETASVARGEDFLNNYHTRYVKLLDDGGGVGWYAFGSTATCPLHPVESV
jgi:hypothetical protein